MINLFGSVDGHWQTSNLYLNCFSITCLIFPRRRLQSPSLLFSFVFKGASSLCPRHLIDSLWPIDATWKYRTGSTLAQAIACCLTAPTHYLIQCCDWLIIKTILLYSSEIHFTKSSPIYSATFFGIALSKSQPHLPLINENQLVLYTIPAGVCKRK